MRVALTQKTNVGIQASNPETRGSRSRYCARLKRGKDHEKK